MSYPTTPAFVHFGDWDNETRRHPAFKWMEHLVTTIFDAQKWDTPYSDIYTDDLVLLMPDGNEIKGGEQAWAKIAEMYGRFKSQHTEPFYNVVTETQYGWEAIGAAWIYGDLHGEPAKHEQKIKDLQGKEWDCRVVGGFRFQYRKVEKAKYDGILMQMIQIMSDSTPALGKMIGRGMIKASDLGFQ